MPYMADNFTASSAVKACDSSSGMMTSSFSVRSLPGI